MDSFSVQILRESNSMFNVSSRINLETLRQRFGSEINLTDDSSEENYAFKLYGALDLYDNEKFDLFLDDSTLEEPLAVNQVPRVLPSFESSTPMPNVPISPVNELEEKLRKAEAEIVSLSASLGEVKKKADKDIRAKEDALISARETFLCLHMASNAEIECIRAELSDCEKQLEHTLNMKQEETEKAENVLTALQTEKNLFWDSLNVKQVELDVALKEIDVKKQLHSEQISKIQQLEKTMSELREHLSHLRKELDSQLNLFLQERERNSLLSKKLETLSSEIASLQSEETDLKEELSELYKDLSAEKENSYIVSNQLRITKSQYAILETELIEVKKDLSEAEAEILVLQNQNLGTRGTTSR